ncbi:recombinase family protein [Streptomyces anulatus]|uniref:recombinase family protein n=1 Tax=Streptomyces anulatus TaxID=1892 RepID=UPI003655EF8A
MTDPYLGDTPVGLEFLTSKLKGSHDPSGIVFTVLAAISGMERECVRDRTLEGHETARKRGKTIGGAGVTDESMLHDEQAVTTAST